MNFINRIITTIKIMSVLYKTPNAFIVAKQLFDFLNETSNNERPMLSKIGLYNVKDGTKITDFVSLWAGIGESNPLQRLENLRNQRDELKRLLLKVTSENYVSNPDDKFMIDYALTKFE